ncbi:MAG: tyrosine--tRNA ligase [Firmicutes bacterium]|nr:tyrosine--tRNA ligase [Bacillota bacterium]
MTKNVFDTLTERGFIKQTIYEEDLYKKLGSESVTFYIGFDPTADSLHIGHYIPIMAMAHMQRAGHRPIALIGNGTAMIGDPSNRSDMRQMMSGDTIDRNGEMFKEQMRRFLRFEGENAAVMAHNGNWLRQLNYVDFIRDIGVYFSVNKMLTADCFKARLEKGLSFLELNYMPMQSYDFLVLHQQYGCSLQLGGNDQWSNMLGGVDLIRRKEQKDAFCITFTLLEKSDGTKMGKTSGGALWLSAAKTPPYDFYQYFRNVEDAKVAECFRLLTFLPLDEINALCAHTDERINAAKERLAYEVTLLVHGQAAADEARAQAVAAFGGGGEMPSVELAASSVSTVADVLVAAGLCASKGEARRLIEGGGVSVDDRKIADPNDRALPAEFVLHKGKKVHVRIILK